MSCREGNTRYDSTLWLLSYKRTTIYNSIMHRGSNILLSKTDMYTELNNMESKSAINSVPG